MNKERIYKFIFYIFILTLALYALIILSNFLPFLPFTFLTGGGCESYKICDSIDAFPVLLFLSLINLVSGILLALFKRISKKFIIIFIIFIVFASFTILISLNSARCSSYNARRKSHLNQIRIAQELYRDTYGKFANNFDELIAAKIFEYPPKDPKTQKVYSDEDGFGLDGGDENPNTWSVRAYIDKPMYKYCVKINEGHWYVCNQNGCYDEVK